MLDNTLKLEIKDFLTTAKEQVTKDNTSDIYYAAICLVKKALFKGDLAELEELMCFIEELEKDIYK